MALGPAPHDDCHARQKLNKKMGGALPKRRTSDVWGAVTMEFERADQKNTATLL
jgi:hypothetical protein